MKVTNLLAALTALTVALSASPALAQTTSKRAERPDPVHREKLDRPAKVEKPGRPEFVDEMKKFQDEFKKAREEQLAERKKALEELKGKTEDERAKLREELKDKHAAWVEEQKKFRERLKELRDELKDHRDKVKDEVAGDANAEGRRGR